MSRRTVLLAAMVALTGCQGTNPTMSAFKLPTPSFDLLAPYGPPRIPPPATYSYGQSGLAPPASAAQRYYPGAVNARGVSSQSPESGDSQPASTSSAQGKVAQAIWKSSRTIPDEASEIESEESTASLASFESSGEVELTGSGDGAAIHIPDVAEQPAEPAKLVLGGMRAHDLTRALPKEPQGVLVATAPTAVLASATIPAPVATQVIYSAPVAAQPVVVIPAATSTTPAPAATGTTSSGLVEITDLPQAAAQPVNRTLQRVRGYETPASAARVIEQAPETFISPQMTISASAALEARDAVAAATVETEPVIVKPAPADAAPGWKSRYSTDES
jgi:hypothetical protein